MSKPRSAGIKRLTSADIIRPVPALHQREGRALIKAWYGPATEDLVAQVLEKLSPGLRTEPDFAAKVHTVIGTLKHELGYSITIEVEVHGDTAKALESLCGDTSNYVSRERPKRRPPGDDHSMCGGGCTG